MITSTCPDAAEAAICGLSCITITTGARYGSFNVCKVAAHVSLTTSGSPCRSCHGNQEPSSHLSRVLSAPVPLDPIPVPPLCSSVVTQTGGITFPLLTEVLQPHTAALAADFSTLWKIKYFKWAQRSGCCLKLIPSFQMRLFLRRWGGSEALAWFCVSRCVAVKSRKASARRMRWLFLSRLQRDSDS